MEYTNLGGSGLRVSRICLGMMSYGTPEWRPWVLDEEASEPLVTRALERGVTFFDTADMYSEGVSEEVTGALLRRHARRDEIVVATKVFMPSPSHADGYATTGDGPPENTWGLSRKHIMHAIDASLTRLGMDYVDLYQIHRFDERTPVEETMEALHDVVKAGKARYIGASSMDAWRFAKAQHVARERGFTEFISMQPHYNLLYREEEREMLPQCRDMDVGVIPWSPLARGRLARPAGQFDEDVTERAADDDFQDWLYAGAAVEVVEAVGEVAEELGASRAQVALAWLLHKDAVTAPIVGARSLDHLDEAVEAVAIELDTGQIERLEEPYRPMPVRGH